MQCVYIFIYLSVFCVSTVCLRQANGSLRDRMLCKERPQSRLQHRGEVQSTSHLQPPKCSFQRQHTRWYVRCWVEATTTCFMCLCNLYILSDVYIYIFFKGRFIHAVLLPVLSKTKNGSCLDAGMNSVPENNETRFVLVVFSRTVKNTFFHISYMPSLLTLMIFWHQNTCCSWGEGRRNGWGCWKSTDQEA